MSIVYGKDYQINVFTDPTYEALGGTVYEPTLDPNANVVTEVGCGEGARTIATQKTVEVKPALRWTMNVRRLEDYITSKAFITAEGAVPAHVLAVKIGSEYHKLTGCKVNRCTLSIHQIESIKAQLEVFAKDREVGASWEFAKRTEEAMWKDAVTTFTIEATPVTNWSEIEITVDNKVLQEILGTSIKPSEVGEREAMYSGRILRAVSGTTLIADALAGTKKDIVIALTDQQSTPVTKTFTFADATLRSVPVKVRGLEIVYEEINWEGKSLVIT